MGIEIERKFLVTGSDWKTETPVRYSQGYLNSQPERTVRVRLAGDAAWLTIKGKTSGASRAEFEYPIPVADAEQMLSLCDPPLIEKHRHIVPFAGKQWEVDEFLAANEGLVVAEIELESESESFEKPPWLGEEVTDDHRYFNSRLAKHPFREWPTTTEE